MGTRVVIWVVLGLLGTWLLLIVALVAARPSGIDLSDARRFLPNVAGLIGRLARDPSLGRSTRVRLVRRLAGVGNP